MYLKLAFIICLQFISAIYANLPLESKQSIDLDLKPSKIFLPPPFKPQLPIGDLLPPKLILPQISPKYTNCTKAGYEDWITLDNKTCYFVNPNIYGVKLSWHDANQRCRSKSAELLSIHSYMNNVIFSTLKPPGFQYISTNYYWIGLNSLAKRGFYKWSDNSAVNYFNYANTTLSNQKITDIYMQGRCVILKAQNSNLNSNLLPVVANGLWYKEDCNSNSGYICAKDFNVKPITPTATPPGNCPSDWYQYANQKCIKVLNQSMTWIQGKAKCLSMEGEMLSIHSLEEQDYVTSIIANKPPPFIGITKNNTIYAWSWDDQSNVTFTNWAKQNNLDDYTQYYNSKCAVIITDETQAGKWLPTYCTSNRTVICERQKDSNIANPPKKAFPACNITGFSDFVQYRNSCYLLVDDQNRYVDFNKAEENCQKMNGAHLVSILNQFEFSFLKYFITQFGKADQYWTGFYASTYSDTNVSQVFKWTDDWPNYFTNWDYNEPLFAGEADLECVYQLKSNGTWRTTDCTSTRAYICKTTTDQTLKLNTDMKGICPKVKTSDKKQIWIDLDKRSKYCYWFSSVLNDNYNYLGLQSWGDASFHCKKRNGTLASIHSSHDLALMKYILTNSTFNTWIGLYKLPDGDFVWEDGSALDFTNWDPNQDIVSKQNPTIDDKGDKCVETKSLDLKWITSICSGISARRNLFVCQVPKIYEFDSSSSSKRLTGGQTAGIVIGVLISVALLAGVVVMVRRYQTNAAQTPSFDNKLYQSRRGQNPIQSGSAINSLSNDITKSDNENPFTKPTSVP